MTRHSRSVERKSKRRILFGCLKEGLVQSVLVQYFHVVVDHVSDVHEHLVKAQSLHLAIPRVGFNEFIKLFARVSEPANVLSQFDDDIWTYSLRVANELQLVKAATSGCVVTCYDDLLLLDGEGESLETWVLGFKDSRIEAVVVLRGDRPLVERITGERNTRTYKMHNHAIFFASWDLSIFHLFLIVCFMPVKSSASRLLRNERISRQRGRRGG